MLALFSAISSFAKPQVVVTTSIIGDWVENVAGDRVTLKFLAGPNTDTHTYEPTPKDAAALAKADIIFENGLELEYWLDPLYRSVNSKAQRVALADNLEDLISVRDDDHNHDQHGRCSHYSEYDPHIWLDPQNAITSVKLVKTHLLCIDPENSNNYKQQEELYVEKLQDLDTWIQKEVGQIPERNRVLVTNHNTFSYFARRYDFENLGNIMGATSTEGVNPSARYITQMIKLIKEREVPAIFRENIQGGSIVTAVALEAGLEMPGVLYVESLSDKSGPAATYVDLMRYNVNTIVDNLKK